MQCGIKLILWNSRWGCGSRVGGQSVEITQYFWPLPTAVTTDRTDHPSESSKTCEQPLDRQTIRLQLARNLCLNFMLWVTSLLFLFLGTCAVDLISHFRRTISFHVYSHCFVQEWLHFEGSHPFSFFDKRCVGMSYFVIRNCGFGYGCNMWPVWFHFTYVWTAEQKFRDTGNFVGCIYFFIFFPSVFFFFIIYVWSKYSEKYDCFLSYICAICEYWHYMFFFYYSAVEMLYQIIQISI